MTRTRNRPPLVGVAMSSVMMMSKVFLPPSTQETLSCHPQALSLHNYLLKVAHNRNHLATKVLSKAIPLPSHTTTLTRKISTTVPHTIRATVFPSHSSSILRCSSQVLLRRVLHPLRAPSKVLVQCSPSPTTMVVGFMVNNTSYPPRPMMTLDTSTTHRNTTTRRE